VRLADGALAAHWLQKSGSDTYAYDVRLSYSNDDGKTWSPSFTPHSDGTKTEHGFASLFRMPGAGLGLVWLDGRAMKPSTGHGGGHDAAAGTMSLRFATYGRDWKQTAEAPVDVRVCECCPTAAVTPKVVALESRGRSSRHSGDALRERQMTSPCTLRRRLEDRRVVNGPMLAPAAARGHRRFTGKDEQGCVRELLGDAGRTAPRFASMRSARSAASTSAASDGS
jgi:hypothetical protein